MSVMLETFDWRREYNIAMRESMRRVAQWSLAFDAIVSLVMLCAACVVMWKIFGGPTQTVRPQSETPSLETSGPIAIADAPRLGRVDAPAAIVEFSDFQCPYCARFETDVFPILREKYLDAGVASLVFMHFPLSAHERAIPAATASDCAGKQGRFWPMHDALFASAGALSSENLVKLAGALALDLASFRQCRDVPDDRIASNVETGRKLGVSGTPTFFVGTRISESAVKAKVRIVGVRPVDEFERAVDSVVLKAK
jgi:protein-disulfide isomerase